GPTARPRQGRKYSASLEALPASFKRLLGSAASGATLPSRFELARRALRGTIRAEDTAITRLWFEDLMTSRALVDMDAGIGRHRLDLTMTTERTLDGRF